MILELEIQSKEWVPGSDDEAGEEPDYCLEGERLEDDETLRLHILGCNSLFSKSVSQLVGWHYDRLINFQYASRFMG